MTDPAGDDFDVPINDGFDALVEAAYAEPTMIVGRPGDDDLTNVAPSPPRPGVDLGVAGSLIQTRDTIRRDRQTEIGSPWRDPRIIGPAALLAGCAAALGWFSTATPRTWSVLAFPVLLVAVAAAWVLYLRYRPTAGERSLSRTIAAERRVSRDLRTALAGSSWVLFHDRRLPHTEHRVPFLAAGPSGLAVIAVLPPGPYLIMAPSGIKAGEDELTSGWLPARFWESRYLLQQLTSEPSRDLRFTGPVFPIAAVGYARADKVSAGWSPEPPYCIDNYQIRTPTALAQYLSYLPVKRPRFSAVPIRVAALG